MAAAIGQGQEEGAIVTSGEREVNGFSEVSPPTSSLWKTFGHSEGGGQTEGVGQS